MAIEVNGVTLPDIPIDVLASYPYAVIARQTDANSGTDVYTLWFSDLPVLFASAEISGEVDCTITDAKNYCRYYYDADDPSSWKSGSVPNIYMLILSEYNGLLDTVLYSNHDIYEITGFTDDNFTLGGVWFPNSEAPSYALEYRVPTDDLLAIADQVRRLTGNSGKLTTEQMGAELSGCDFTLQEKNVTPTDTAQEVTPDSGYWGLSKVTVQPSSGIVLAENERIYQVSSCESTENAYDLIYESSVTGTLTS